MRVEVGPVGDADCLADGPFDLVFLDADKPGYRATSTCCSTAGCWPTTDCSASTTPCSRGSPGRASASVNGVAVAAFNERLRADPRVEQVVLPLRDGVTLVRKV